MSEHESEFLKQVNAVYLKMKKLHKNTIATMVIISGIIVTFGVVVLVQGFETTKISSEANTNLKMVSETQTLMYEVFNTQISDVKAKATEDKSDLQRQLDLIMRDRKIIERGVK